MISTVHSVNNMLFSDYGRVHELGCFNLFLFTILGECLLSSRHVFLHDVNDRCQKVNVNGFYPAGPNIFPVLYDHFTEL
jgi:hypothetical protein